MNSAICFRTPDAVLAGWSEALGDERFGAAALAPIFTRLEEELGIGPARESAVGTNNRLIVRGVDALGLPGGLVHRNTPACMGCGLCNFGCPVNGKATVNLVLLPDAVRDGARIQADVKVDRVRVEAVPQHELEPACGESWCYFLFALGLTPLQLIKMHSIRAKNVFFNRITRNSHAKCTTIECISPTFAEFLTVL